MNDVVESGVGSTDEVRRVAGTSASVSRQTRYFMSVSDDGDQLTVTFPSPADVATPCGVGSFSGRMLVIR